MTQPTKNARPHGPMFCSKRSISRRSFLRGAGTAVALPMLSAMTPAFSKAARASQLEPDGKPRRMLAVCNNLGLLPDQFFPEQSGRDYELSPYLQEVADHRRDFTVFSGVWHPDVDGGHPADICFLTAAPHPARGGFRNTISLDQYMAERIGHLTRVPSLNLGVNTSRRSRSISWTSSGVLIPCEESSADVFKRLFLQGSEAEVDAQVKRLELGQSVLDAVAGQAKSLKRTLGRRDQQRLDQYYTSVRELEKRMTMSREWATTPKPVVAEPVPVDPQDPRDYMDKFKLMLDLTRLAFETDSTRIVSMLLDGVSSPAMNLDGDTRITDGYHNLSHHGKNEEKISQLKEIDAWHLRLFNEFFTDLKTVQEDGEPLLDRTMVLYGSNMGDADKHVTTNLPILFAGGGFRHGQHLMFDKHHNYPLPNLFVSMLQRMGIEADQFATSTGTMSGLDFA